ncbi:MAG: hypothetical protein Q7K26_04390 [bacterium]|nr:hypothetical protein [bacterium]
MTFQRISGISSISQTIRAKILSRRRNTALKLKLTILKKDDSVELDGIIEDFEELEARIKRPNVIT